MAIAVTQIEVQEDSTTGTSLASGTISASVAVGDQVWVLVTADNAGTSGVSSIGVPTDSGGNTYALVKEQNRTSGAANDGDTAAIYRSIITTALTTSSTITANFSPTTVVKGFIVFKVTGAADTVTGTVGGSGTATTYSLATSSMGTDTLVMMIVVQAASSAPGADADTTNGSWTQATYGTSALGAGNNLRSRSGYKVVTGSGAQTFNGSIVSQPWAGAGAWIGFKVSSSFTADAVLLRSQAGSATANAEITQPTVSSSFTADGILKFPNVPGSLTSNGVFFHQHIGSVTANAVIGSVASEANHGFVATTSNQKVYTSHDLVTWTERDSTAPTGGSGNWKVEYGNGRWLLSGSYFNGVTFVPWVGYSDDGGASWQDTGFTPAGNLTVAWGLDTWVGAGGEIIYASADGVAWDTVDSTSLSNNGYVDQILFDGAFVLVGGDDAGAITMLSLDGRTWNPTTPPTGWDEAAQVIRFADTCFLYGWRDGFTTAVFGHSDDLLTWTEDGTFDWDLLATDGTTLINVGYDGSVTTIETSPDGYNWTSGTISDIEIPLSFRYEEGLWFGSSNNSSSPGIFKSSNGTSWTTYNATLPGVLPGVITDLKIGNIPYTFTADAVLRRSPSLSFTADAVIDSTLVRHIAVGSFYTGSNFVKRSIASPLNSTGPTWTTTDIASVGGFADVAYLNGKWVAVASSRSVWVSTDGLNWDEVPNAFAAFDDGTFIAAGNGIFVVWTDEGNAYYSSDAITWTQGRATDSNILLNDLVFANGQFLLIGDYSVGLSHAPFISASANGTSWTDYTTPTGTSSYRGFDSIAHDGTTYVAILFDAGSQRFVGQATSLSSWSVASFTSSGALNYVEHGGSYWVIGASTGRVYYSTTAGGWNTSNFVAVSSDGIDGLEYSGEWLAFDFNSIYATGSDPTTGWVQVFDESGSSHSIFAIATGQVSQLVRTFTAGAVLKQTPAGNSFAADALIERFRLTAGAVLRKLDRSVSFTGDAVIGYARPGDVDDLTSARNRHDRATTHFGTWPASRVVHDEESLLEDLIRDLWNRVAEYEEGNH